jgi:hypothetical protein
MKQVKLSFAALRIPKKIQKAKNIVLKMTGNATYTTPSPSLASVTTAISRLETSYEAALDKGITKTAIMRTDELNLDNLMALLMNYVQDASGGDELKILSSGMDVKSKSTSPQALPMPENLKSAKDSDAGEAKLKWSPVVSAKAYLVQSSPTPDVLESWTFFDACTRADYIAMGLASQTTIWFRVAALGAKGLGPWSDATRASIS